LFNTRNSRELVGKTALFESDDVVLFNNNIMRIRFTNEVLPQYMISLFQTPFIQNQLESRKAGTTSVFAIYAKNLNTVEIPLPPVALQEKFCDLRCSLLSQRETRRTGCGEARNLFDSLIQRAFLGKL
jgi:type I restriction enzyme S subunit